LPHEKAILVDSYARMLANRDNEYFINALERCYSAAIVNQLDLDWGKIEGIIKVFGDFMEEDANKMKSLKEVYGGDFEMATKKVNEQGPKVEERVRILLGEGKKQKEIVEILAIDFPTLSKAMLTNAYKKTKEMIKKEETTEGVINAAIDVKKIVDKLVEPDIDVEKGLEYIFGKEDVKSEAVVTKDDEIKEEVIVVPKIEVPEAETHFEIIKEVRILDLKGKYGQYHIEKNVVEVTDLDLAFDSEGAVEDWAETARLAIWSEIEKLQNEMNSITDREIETIKVIQKFM
ncbi:MAG: hypothetical protein ACRC7S_17345, partial [Cetobacterium sp.]